MFDDLFRRYKDDVFAPLTRLAIGISPTRLTLAAVVFGFVAAGLAALGWFGAALVAWLLNRLFDGLDGAVARRRGVASDLGGYLDIVLDFAVYAAVPLGVVVSPGASSDTVLACAVLLASFYVNAASWMMLSAILEKRAQGAAARGEVTTVTMPPGVAGAVVTFAFFTAFLLWPGRFVWLAFALAALCGVSIAQRVTWAVRHLRTDPARSTAQPGSRTWPVIVVGGGAAGLAAARALQQRGVECLVLEQNAIGHVWTRHYDSLKLNTHRDASALPGLALPRDVPCFPTGTQVRDYLTGYAHAFSLVVETGVAVVTATVDDAGWRLTTNRGEHRCADLVMATGIWSQPVEPTIVGRETFPGRILHSHAYRNPAAFTGQRVLVVGSGNSGAEIAAELGEAGVATWIAIRRGVTFVDRPHSGLQMSVTSALLRHAPRRLVAAVLKSRRRDFSAIGLPRAALPETDVYPVVGFRLPDAVRAGRVQVVGAPVALSADGVILPDGNVLGVDAIILATGYRPALGPVAGYVDLSDGWPVLDGYRSTRCSALYCLGFTYTGLEGWLQAIGRHANAMAAQLCAKRG